MSRPRTSLRPLNLMVEQVEAVTMATVEVVASSDDASRLPLVRLDVSAPAPVTNGPPEASAAFRATITAQAEVRQDAADLCHDVLDGLLDSWRQGRRTPHGVLSHLRVTALPYLSTLGARPGDGVWAFTAVIDVVARH